MVKIGMIIADRYEIMEKLVRAACPMCTEPGTIS